MNRTVWLLWLQGWEHAPWLIQKVAESWEFNNPTWTIRYLDWENLPQYVTDAPYLFDTSKNIAPAHIADITRLSLLKNYGGVWADATLLCLQPLDTWVDDAVRPAGLWMYAGHGAGMSAMNGPVIWFIVSETPSPLIDKWKEACDDYWQVRTSTDDYFWLDGLFREIYESDAEFRTRWHLAPHLYCESRNQSHSLSRRRLDSSDRRWKEAIRDRPPYVMKFWWKVWEQAFPDPLSRDCQASNGGFAIQMSTRSHLYKHEMAEKGDLRLRAKMQLADLAYSIRRSLKTGRSLIGRCLKHRSARA